MATVQNLPTPGLSETQMKAVSLLALGTPVTDIATACGVTRMTIHNWRKLPAFRDHLEDLLAQAKEQAGHAIIRDIAEVKELVLGTLIDVARNDSSGSARVAAARTLKEYMDEAQRRAQEADNDLMADRSGEIKAILEHIKNEKAGSLPFPPE